MTSESQEAKNSPPLEVVGDESTTTPVGDPENTGGRGGGLRKVFWIAAFALVLLAVAALGTTGYLGQRELRGRIAGLEGELLSTRAALAAEQRALSAAQARADGLQTTMGRVNELSNELAASLQELQALTGSAPVVPAAPSAGEPSPAAQPGVGSEASETTSASDGAAAQPVDADAEAAIEAPPSSGDETPGAALEMGDSAPLSLEEDTTSELAVPEAAAPSILERSGGGESSFAGGAPTTDDLDAELSEIADPDALDRVAASGVELPVISAAAAPSDVSSTEAAQSDALEASDPIPLWERLVERLRALAPSE